jgi:cytochrome c oxidase subunit IV
MDDTTATHGDEHGIGHVVPLPLLVGVLAALLVLTFVTVAVTWVDLGAFNIWLALIIAAIKASVVALYFMHLRWDSPFNAVILICALLFVAVFIGFALMDTLNYQPDMDVPRGVTVYE